MCFIVCDFYHNNKKKNIKQKNSGNLSGQDFLTGLLVTSFSYPRGGSKDHKSIWLG